MKRKCANPYCKIMITSAQVACPRDWWSLPGEIRHEVLAAYRGRGKDARRHLVAVGTAVKWFRANLDPAVTP